MKNRLKRNLIFSLLVVALAIGIVTIQSCSKNQDSLHQNPNETMQLTDEAFQGGQNGTINLATGLSFAQPIPGLTTGNEIDFKVGRSFFHTSWVTAPSSTSAVDGLGPLFNAISCNSCHVEDGRGRTPFSPMESLSSVLIRLSIPGVGPHGGPNPDPELGFQLRNRSILQATPDGDVFVTYTDKIIPFTDGTTDTLRVPTYQFVNLRNGHPVNFMFSPRIANQLAGMGLLEAVPESTILSFADENDKNNDGISGRANYVWDEELQKTVPGRFGWKANQPSVRQQVAAALSGDIGITNPVEPLVNLFGSAKGLYSLLPDGSNKPGEQELPEPFFTNTVFYTQALAVPKRRNWTDAVVQKGKKIFAQATCNSCHIPEMKTGNFPSIPLLSNQVIHPYTDLLLHDMGNDLADNRSDFLATGSEWRTAPLWGIGLVSKVNNNNGMFLMHDGRARTIEEAILWHGGEAQHSKQLFMNLPKEDRDALIKFVNDL
ncbi:MAG: di-heme oxidoredictase family protein [Mucilaginibacter sp.]